MRNDDPCRDDNGFMRHDWTKWEFIRFIPGTFSGLKALQYRECAHCGLNEWRKDKVL